MRISSVICREFAMNPENDEEGLRPFVFRETRIITPIGAVEGGV